MICNCNAELEVREFTDDIITYCTNCSKYVIDVKICEHEEKIPVKIKISGGGYQVRLYCKVCQKLESKSLKQSNYDLSKLHETDIEKYNVHRSKLIESESAERKRLMDFLIQNRQISRREVYLKYMQSNEWRATRLKIMHRDNWTCQICGNTAEEVHHLTYQHLGNEYDFELVALCKKCHDIYPSSFKQ